jgi:type VI secretion system protein ImpG
MSQELWPFYDRELRFLRELAVEFKKKYPREAQYLGQDDAGRSNDPHVERLMQSVALLAARVRHKVDDDFPELTDALFHILYPHYLAPVPSMAVVELTPNPGTDLADGLTVPRHARFQARANVAKQAENETVRCEYRTTSAVTLWPMTVAEARLIGPPLPDDRPIGTGCILHLRFEAKGGTPLTEAVLGTPGRDGTVAPARLFLSGDGPLTAALYEVLFNDVLGVVFCNPNGPERTEVIPGAEALRPVGFAADEGVLPYPKTAFPGYRLLTEFFAYREKFLFLDLAGWDKARAAGALTRTGVEVLVYLGREVNPEYERAVTARTFRLGCTPVVNLFEKITDGIAFTQQKYDYPLVPDRHNLSGHEVFAVDAVYHRNPSTGLEVTYEPFYSYRHHDRDSGRRYWYASRKGSFWDNGTEVDLHFVDLDFTPALPAEGIVLAKVTCLNRDLPEKLALGADLRFEPISALPVSVRWLRAPTKTLRPRLGRGAYWRLVSHLALNHLSIADGSSGKAALQEYLSLYDFADQAPELATVAQKVRDGILSVSGVRDVAFVPNEFGGGYARGTAVTVELQEDNYVGVGAYLFGSVLERFYALYASLNSYTRFTLKTKQRDELARWPARAGEKVLV